MTQSTLSDHPLHVAIVLDGNGRWAEQRGLPRTAGHAAGVRRVRPVVSAAPALGIGTLTMFAFSADNWKRPDAEVQALLGLLDRAVRQQLAACLRDGVRLTFPGRRDRLPADLVATLDDAERRTALGLRLRLRIAIDYSARDTIVAAAAWPGAAYNRDAFLAALARAGHEADPAPEVDLLIRTGGEHRLSDFLLYECAYAELEFLDLPWPEFRPRDLAACVEAYARRERRFGAVLPKAV